MALYRAKTNGQHPDGTGKRIRQGDSFKWDGAPGAWMELVEASPPAPSEPAPAPAPIEAVAPPVVETESAPVAEPKRKTRKGAE